MSIRNQIFVSYSHKDQEWLTDLKTHLRPYMRNNQRFAVWEGTQIQPGAEWFEAIKQAIASAKIAVLLVSPDFLASEFIDANELPPLLEAASNGELTIYWIPVRSSAYRQTRINQYQAAYSPDKPLDSLDSAARDKAWVEICETLNKTFRSNSEPT